jgi:iron complex transport system substrate-binding protein
MVSQNKLGQLLLAGLTFFISAACFAQISVKDDLGRVVRLAEPAKRIVSLAPHNTENLFTAGAGAQIVGTVDHSDYPQQALDIPRVGNYKQVNIEAILGLKPDLIIAWSSGNTNESVQRLIDLGIPVFYSEPHTFEEIINNIERLARLSGQLKNATPRLEGMRQTFRDLESDYSGKKPLKIFYQVWDQPLITLNGDHSVSHAFELCGGINVFADQPTIAPRINIEGVIAQNPQLILLAGHSATQTASWIDTWSKWTSIDAVSSGQIKNIDADVMNRPTLRFLEGTRQVCEIIESARRAIER